MTDKQPEALRLAEKMDWLGKCGYRECKEAAAVLRRLHEVNAELLEALQRIRLERGFTCDCGIESATWELIESAIAKTTGEQQ
jgi:hypothetical protein